MTTSPPTVSTHSILAAAPYLPAAARTLIGPGPLWALCLAGPQEAEWLK